MKCKESENLILRFLDSLITPEEENRLLHHLRKCPRCSQLKKEYIFIRKALILKDIPDTKSHFWERLKPKLAHRETLGFWPSWKTWSLGTVPLAMLVIAIGVAVLFLILPQTHLEQSPSETLLKNQNPLSETKPLFEENPENISLQLIFSSLDEKDISRRYFP